MKAATGLKEWGLHRVRMFFGKVRPVEGLAEDTIVTGDLVQNAQGTVYEFLYRENGMLYLKEV